MSVLVLVCVGGRCRAHLRRVLFSPVDYCFQKNIIVTYMSDSRRDFGLDIGFIDHFNTTRNCT
jgi:hypothetical protein